MTGPVSESDESLPIGTVVDRYVVEAVLGTGGMATVYLARHRQLDTIHALKLLNLGGRRIAARLMAEGKVQALLRHPYLVAVSDVVLHEGMPGLVLEYVPGTGLDTWLGRHRPTLAQIDALARGILRGVAFAHASGVVHRDLKPANVMLAVSGDRLVPKVMDFGLVKVTSQSATTPATRAGVVMGTPQYMAPEQFVDSSSVDARADVFSLGALLYELATGHPAFQAEELTRLFSRVTLGDYAPPQELVPGLPERMCAAIRGALLAERDQRIASAERLLEIWSGEVPEEAICATFGESELYDAASLDAARPAVALPERVVTPSSLVPQAETPILVPQRLRSAPPAAEPKARRRVGLLAWLVPVAGLAALSSAAVAGAALVGIWLAGLEDVEVVPPPPPAALDAPAPEPERDAAAAAPEPEPEPPPAAGRPAPSRVKPEPAPPAPPPAPEPVDANSWVRAGSSQILVLVDPAGQRYLVPGAVPPGTYRVLCDAKERGKVEVPRDRAVTLSCDKRRCELN